LSWSCVDFSLNLLYECGRQTREVRAFGYVLSDEFVSVLYRPFLPRAVGVGEIDGCSYHPRDCLVCAGLAAVVRCDGLHSVAPVWEQLPYGGFGCMRSILTVCELLYEQEVGGAFREGEYGSLAVLSDDCVHFPVAEACAVCFDGAVVDARATRDVPHFRRAVGSAVAVILHRYRQWLLARYV